MSAHTPGPWKLELFYESGDKYSEIVPKNYKTSALHEPICIIPHDDVSEESEPEMLANARLIASAPELLEALLSMMNNQAVCLDCTKKQYEEAIALLTKLGAAP